MVYDHLFDFQKDAFSHLKNESQVAFFLDMGLGKTITSLAWLEQNGANNITLIVCPKNQIDHWLKNCEKWLDNSWNVSVLKNSWKNQFKILSKKQPTKNVIIMTYGKLPPTGVMFYNTKSTIIFDESQYLKSHKSTRGKKGLAISRYFNKVALLSGDPISNNYLDLYNQLLILKAYNESYDHFMFEFFHTEFNIYSRKYDAVKIKDGSIEKIKKLIEHKSVWLKTEDAYDLPEQNFIDIFIKRNKYYDFMEKYEVLNDWKANSTIAWGTALRQLSSGYHKKTIYDQTKIKRLEELFLATNDKKIIIFYHFTQTIDIIKKANIKNYKLFFLNGAHKQKDEFLNEKNNSILVVQYQAGSEGTDGLQDVSRIIIYIEPTRRGGLYKQSIKRIHRIGQKQKVIYYRFKTQNSIDEDIYQVIEQGKDYTDELYERKKKHMLKNETEVLNQIQNNSLFNSADKKDDDYKNHATYEQLKKLKKPDLLQLANDLNILGLKSNISKEEVIKAIIENEQIQELMTNEKIEKKEDSPTFVLGDISLKDDPNITVFSQSRLQTFLTNPRDYKHKYIDKLRSPQKNANFLIGSVMHKMIEVGGDVEKTIEQINKYDTEYDNPDRNEVIDKGIILGESILDVFKFNDTGVHELEFIVRVDEKRAFRGFIDQLWEDEKGDFIIGEWKTAANAATIKNKLNYSFQAHLYAMAVYKTTGKKPKQFIYRVAQKPRIKKNIKETYAEYLVRYKNECLKTTNGSFVNFFEFIVSLNWNRVEEIWNSAIDIMNMIDVCKTFPINDFTANLFGSWEYNVLYDPMISNAEELFLKIDEK